MITTLDPFVNHLVTFTSKQAKLMTHVLYMRSKILSQTGETPTAIELSRTVLIEHDLDGALRLAGMKVILNDRMGDDMAFILADRYQFG